MIDAAIYERVTGRIRRTLVVNELTLGQTPMEADEALVVGKCDPDLHYVFQGRLMHRPPLPEFEVTGTSVAFASALPDGAVLHVLSNFLDAEFSVTAVAVALAVPESAHLRFTAPWPYQEVQVELDGSAVPAPDDAQIIWPDLDRMKDYFRRAVAARGDELADTMLGNPDDHTRARWKLKRSIRDRYLAGTNSAADEAAMAESVRYSDLTVQEELDRIGAKVAFEDWFTMRADGIRQETERRLDVATAPEEALAVIGWAEAESAAAVAEAQAKLAV